MLLYSIYKIKYITKSFKKRISICTDLFEKSCNFTLLQIHFSGRKGFVGSCSIITHFLCINHLIVESYLCVEYFMFFYLITVHLGSNVIITRLSLSIHSGVPEGVRGVRTHPPSNVKCPFLPFISF